MLAEIVTNTRRDVAGMLGPARMSELRARADEQLPARSLAAALRRDGVHVIAEVKRRSPSAGELAGQVDPVAQALMYERAGAAAVSVLTDARYFGGSIDDLAAVRAAGIGVPVLRKDFIVHELQLLEARAYGADAVLLIAGVLDHEELGRLLGITHDLGMEALVEAHSRDEVQQAVASGASIVGINNRDLQTFTTSIQTTVDLAPQVPAGRIVVSESGISSRDDVDRLAAVGVRAMLVGEALMRSDRPEALLGELTS